jgi:3-O-methylgallate 3,4-dioxygenase
MAEIVLGIGTSHSPVQTMPPELMPEYAQHDPRSRRLIMPPTGKTTTYEELLEHADPAWAAAISPETFAREHDRYQKALAILNAKLEAANPDTLVIFGDDQEELFYDDNMPMISIYWGETIPWLARPGGAPIPDAVARGYGDQDMDVPVDSELALHLIRSLIADDFDIAQSRYLNEEYGGSVGPIGYLATRAERPRHREGLPHAYGFVLKRVTNGRLIPIVPVTQNTCYPPNQISSRRSYALGQAVRKAIEAWPADRRVVVIGSGGLSHAVVDEELDRLALGFMQKKDAEGLAALPPERLQTATSEINNWVAAAGALEPMDMHLVDYIPARRTPAGTGGGWGFAYWS